MAQMFYDDAADLQLIQSKKVAVIGYGSQGHAHARNLHDSGVAVRVGLQPTSGSASKARAAGLTVTSVADEVRDGMIRVECRLAAETPPALPLQHGLPGVVEIAIEHVSPATLVLRQVGTRLGGSTRSAGAAGPEGGAP